ncbi:butyrophilin-like protein 2 [Perca flavescens]|uniref:butyrophilin-like protein 2 n=1 Tax=Perca flavescens TaxID=8167 RepID=UPI00106E934D|nr:butyrophilin-like protein 2 [Perca flavescens]
MCGQEGLVQKQTTQEEEVVVYKLELYFSLILSQQEDTMEVTALCFRLLMLEFTLLNSYTQKIGSTCTIERLYPADSGEYWCETEGGDTSNTVNISVTVGSVILESPVLPLMEGETVTMRCRNKTSSTNLPADFYKDGRLMKSRSGEEMTINNVSKSDEGLYKCSIAGNGESPESWLAVGAPHRETCPFSDHFSYVLILRTVFTIVMVALLLLLGLLHSGKLRVKHKYLILMCKGQSQLTGSSIVATLGNDIILPYQLEPVEDATDLTLEWTRSDLDPRFVHVWRSGKELVSKKHKSFEGRTSLFVDELMSGNISLKLSKVKLADRGTYRCFIPGLDRQSFVQLHVGAVSSPVISLVGLDRDKGGVVLQCESEGWYPEPEVLWLDGEGNLLSAGPPETVRGPDDLYTVSSSVTVEKRPSNRFTCRVQQKDTNQTRETEIHVPGKHD